MARSGPRWRIASGFCARLTAPCAAASLFSAAEGLDEAPLSLSISISLSTSLSFCGRLTAASLRGSGGPRRGRGAGGGAPRPHRRRRRRRAAAARRPARRPRPAGGGAGQVRDGVSWGVCNKAYREILAFRHVKKIHFAFNERWGVEGVGRGRGGRIVAASAGGASDSGRACWALTAGAALKRDEDTK